MLHLHLHSAWACLYCKPTLAHSKPPLSVLHSWPSSCICEFLFIRLCRVSCCCLEYTPTLIITSRFTEFGWFIFTVVKADLSCCNGDLTEPVCKGTCASFITWCQLASACYQALYNHCVWSAAGCTVLSQTISLHILQTLDLMFTHEKLQLAFTFYFYSTLVYSQKISCY